jgi:hypothetical protein
MHNTLTQETSIHIQSNLKVEFTHLNCKSMRRWSDDCALALQTQDAARIKTMNTNTQSAETPQQMFSSLPICRNGMLIFTNWTNREYCPITAQDET